MDDQRLRSKWWRLTHLYKILDKQGDLVTFSPNVMQLLHLAESAGVLRLLLVKARQFGFTTLYCLDMLDDACFVPGSTNAIIAHEREAVDKIFQIVKRAYENMPDVLRPIARKDTERAYRFDKRFDGTPLNSEIYVALKIRSTTVRRLHITESAHIKNRQELEAGSKQAVPKDGRVSEETTGNGFGAFYDAYMQAKQNTNPGHYDARAYFYAWFLNPDYSLPGELTDITTEEKKLVATAKAEFGADVTDAQLVWRRWKMRDLVAQGDLAGLRSDQLFKQEYPSTVMEAFQSGAGNVFDAEKIEQAVAKVRKPMRTTLGLTVWLEPRPGHRYMIGCDPSDGMGADYAVIDVWDLGTLEQVAQWAGKMHPDELAKKVKSIGIVYFYAFAGVENNMLTTILYLVKTEHYPNYYTTVREDERTKKKTEKMGWTTSSQSRDLMIDEFVIDFEDDQMRINSLLTLDQMRTFVKKPENGKREHAEGKHDDALFAGMIAYQMRKHYRGRATESDFVTSGKYEPEDDDDDY
jgi:hypothetical protein